MDRELIYGHLKELKELKKDMLSAIQNAEESSCDSELREQAKIKTAKFVGCALEIYNQALMQNKKGTLWPAQIIVLMDGIRSYHKNKKDAESFKKTVYEMLSSSNWDDLLHERLQIEPPDNLINWDLLHKMFQEEMPDKFIKGLETFLQQNELEDTRE